MSTANKRRFPRAKETLPVRLTLDEDGRRFEAHVQTADISLTGVFLASEFYLKPGMTLNLELTVPNDERTVRVKGVVVREVRLAERSHGSTKVQTGFGMRFIEYYADAKTVLASSFLSAELDDFVADYLKRRTKKLKTELEQLRDVVVAWEVGKMEIKGGELDLMKDRITVDTQGHIRRR